MTRKSSKNREKAFLRKCRSKETPELEEELGKIENTEGQLPSKVIKRIELIRAVLEERSGSRVKIFNAVENV